MKTGKFINILAVLFISLTLQAQDQTIFFGQQKAISNLSADAGVSATELDKYLKKRYKRPLYQLTQAEGAEIIKGFQDGALSRS